MTGGSVVHGRLIACGSTSPNLRFESRPDADRRHKILITDKLECSTTFREWREKGESFRVDRYSCMQVAGYVSNHVRKKIKVANTETAFKQEPYV